jgi:hypothetical protein
MGPGPKGQMPSLSSIWWGWGKQRPELLLWITGHLPLTGARCNKEEDITRTPSLVSITLSWESSKQRPGQCGGLDGSPPIQAARIHSRKLWGSSGHPQCVLQAKV